MISCFNTGGCREFSDKGLDIQAAKVFSDEAYERLISGEYKSLNVEYLPGLVRFSYELTHP